MIASGKMEDPGSLPGNEKTVLEVPVKVPHNILVSLVRDIGADWDIDYQLDLGLTIDLPLFGDFTIPLSRKGEIKLPTLSDVFWSTPLLIHHFLLFITCFGVFQCTSCMFDFSCVCTLTLDKQIKIVFGSLSDPVITF